MMRPVTNRAVSRNACLWEPPRPNTQVPMNGRQVTVQAVRPSDTPSSQMANSVVSCGISAGLKNSSMLVFLCLGQPDHLVFRQAFRGFQFHAIFVSLAGRTEQLDAEELDLDHIVVRAILHTAAAHGAVLMECLPAVFPADLVNIHRAGFFSDAALVALVVLLFHQLHRREPLK